MPQGPFYKIKLSSGRILGPLDVDRIRRLIRKNKLTGAEDGREYPKGEWRVISQIPALAELFLEAARQQLKDDLPPQKLTKSSAVPPQPKLADPEAPDPLAPTVVLAGPTQILAIAPEPVPPPASPLPGAAQAQPAAAIEKTPLASTTSTIVDGGTVRTIAISDHEPTIVTPTKAPAATELSITRRAEPRKKKRKKKKRGGTDSRVSPNSRHFPAVFSISKPKAPDPRSIANEATIVFQSPSVPDFPTAKKRATLRERITTALAILAVAIVGYQLFFQKDMGPPDPGRAPIRPRLPDPIVGKPDPKGSQRIYNEAMRLYVLDNVEGYRVAAEKLRVAAALNPANVRAYAMLASSYLNLIDSSNKDENYFNVISKLIDLTRAKAQDIPETVIADVEFYLTANKPEAAQARIVEYAKTHPHLQIELYYYLALAFHARGNDQSAARYLAQIPDDKAFSPKVFYLRGEVAQKLGDEDRALEEYRHAKARGESHVRSRLKIAEILYGRDQIRAASDDLEYMIQHPKLLAPKDLGRAYYLHAQLASALQSWSVAIFDIERAVKLDKDNHEYLLQLYTLEAKAGENVAKYRDQARMYFFLGEGERMLRQAKYHDALTQFLQARQANASSYIPLVKIGDMFLNLHDMANARMNYRMAAERAPRNIEVWSKYISVLIDSYEFEEAQAAMSRFREIPGTSSTIDKLAGDLYEKENLHAQAQMHYQNAMKRDSIDPGVYIAYANSLMATKKYEEAPFFFALAMRLDPLNVDALIGTAKCVAESESKDRAIRMLQDELQKGTYPSAELLGGIAELYISKGDYDEAQKYIDQAIAANPAYAYPYKIQAQIYMEHADRDKSALNKALQSYQAYSDRNPSDPSGYRDSYTIYLRMNQYEKASDELSKIFAIYPKYSNLHLYKGVLYSIMQNHKYAVEELMSELKNNPNNVTAMVALGKELVAQGESNQALVYLNKAMAMDPKNAGAKLTAGYANFLLKNYAGAVALYNAAQVFDQNNPQIYMRLSQAYNQQGDTANAQAACQKYLQLDPNAADKECLRYR